MNTPTRRIGRVGTASRVIVALGLPYLAVTNGGGLVYLSLPNGWLSWDLTWSEAVLGLIALPGIRSWPGSPPAGSLAALSISPPAGPDH